MKNGMFTLISTVCHIFAPVLDFCTIHYPPTKTFKFDKHVGASQIQTFDWRIVNCPEIKNGSKNVTYCMSRKK